MAQPHPAAAEIVRDIQLESLRAECARLRRERDAFEDLLLTEYRRRQPQPHEPPPR